MAEPLRIELSAAAALFAEADIPREFMLQAARGEIELPAGDFGGLLLYLAHSPDQGVSSTAVSTLRGLSGERLAGTLDAPQTNPRLLEIMAHLHNDEPDICERIVSHPSVGEETLTFLAGCGFQLAQDLLSTSLPLSQADENLESTAEPGEDEEPVDEEQYQSKYQMAQNLGVSEKIKMALTGDKEWRSILIKDSNKLVSGSVMKNPRITDNEVLNIAKSTAMNDDIMRSICMNKEWVKVYPIRKALVENSKTPLPFALRFMSTLGEKDIAALGKSKSVSSVISTQAKRMLLSKKKN